jgi:hypothetical protein
MSSVPGVQVGQIVRSVVGSGRRFKVLRTDEHVVLSLAPLRREGPYCRLQALDDRSCEVLYPRSWYTLPGESLALFPKVPA